MKVRTSVKKMCKLCKIVKRNNVIVVTCENDKKHKQRQG